LHTRNKLAEAKYFLDILPNMTDDDDGFHYNLSAFLSAWRSTLDIMLYDLAEHFLLCFTREDDMSKRDFEVAAKALRNRTALQFISWWGHTQSVLGNTPLWRKRNINVHRGPLALTRQTRTLLVTGSGGTSGTISPYSVAVDQNAAAGLGSLVPQAATVPMAPVAPTPTDWYFDDLPDRRAIDICNDAYLKMQEIVVEAETTFNVRL
jgi:hypothetical protein